MENKNQIPKRYSVNVGEFNYEKSAIERAELCKRSGIMAEVRDLGNNDMGNLTAAVLLIAEQLKDLNAKVDALTVKLSERAVTPEAKAEKPAKEEKTSERSNLSKMLISARQTLGLSQAAASTKAGLGATVLQRWETGSVFPRQANLRGYCAALGIPWDAVLEAAKKDGAKW